MKAHKIFNQAVTGIALAASVAVPSLAKAEEGFVRVPKGSMCIVHETEVQKNENYNGEMVRSYDFSLGALIYQKMYERNSMTAPSISAIPFSSVNKEKVEEMQKYLPPACKTKLGMK